MGTELALRGVTQVGGSRVEGREDTLLGRVQRGHRSIDPDQQGSHDLCGARAAQPTHCLLVRVGRRLELGAPQPQPVAAREQVRGRDRGIEQPPRVEPPVVDQVGELWEVVGVDGAETVLVGGGVHAVGPQQ